MFAHVSIETDRIADAVVVPREAVQRDRMGSYVMTVDEGQKAKRVDVITQGEDEDYISIGDSLPVGTKVVTMSAMPVREGQTIVPGGGKPGKGGRGGRPQGDNAR
jgi:multidrug efflux pump subunit AcrA (membrane-fusion protein)